MRTCSPDPALPPADARPLVDGRRKRCGVVRRAAVGLWRVDGDEARQIFVRGSQAVQNPRAEAGAGELKDAAVHLQKRLRVVGQVGVHAVEHAQLVGMLGDFGKQFAYPQTTCSMLGELER